MDSELRQRKALEQDLHHALSRGELELYYQPQINLTTRSMVGVEALLRWHHPKHGLILPDRFVPLAEDTGLILPIGAWVLERACEQAREWQRAGLPQLRISVNLSPVQFRDPDLARLVRDALERSELAPERLELEITERTLMEDTESTLAILRELKDLGVKISIDDFGVGHASLGYLRRFAFDALRKGGKLVQVGLFGGEMTLPLPLMPIRALTVQGSYVGNPRELRDLIGIAKTGKLPGIPITRMPLAQADTALNRLREGKVVGRIVLTAEAA